MNMGHFNEPTPFATSPTKYSNPKLFLIETRRLAESIEQGLEPTAREPDVALLMTASCSLDIFLTRLVRIKIFL